MTSPHQSLSQNLKILRERFYKWIFHFIFDFHLSINIGTWNTNLDLYDPFLGWWRHHGGSKFQNSEIVLSKTKISPQFFLYYWLSSFYHHWYIEYKSGPFLTQFWVNYVTMRVKTVILWESDLWHKILTSMFHKIMISVFLSLSIHDIQLWALFTQFGDNDVTKEINIQEFWNIN